MYSDYETDINYSRVIPRDLFNEAKLLKCIGQLTCNIHDGEGLGLKVSESVTGFKIGLMNDGFLIVENIHFKLGKIPLLFRTTYNSKKSYPLVCTYDYCDIPVFEENGTYTEEYTTFINSL